MRTLKMHKLSVQSEEFTHTHRYIHTHTCIFFFMELQPDQALLTPRGLPELSFQLICSRRRLHIGSIPLALTFVLCCLCLVMLVLHLC